MADVEQAKIRLGAAAAAFAVLLGAQTFVLQQMASLRATMAAVAERQRGIDQRLGRIEIRMEQAPRYDEWTSLEERVRKLEKP